MSNGRHDRGRPYGDRSQRGPDERARRELPSIDVREIQLGKPAPKLFDEVAQAAAKTIAEGKPANKPSQVRKFFDELVMWETKINGPADQDDAERERRFQEMLPFLRMMNAKVAYATGRKLVDENFQTFFSHCLKQIQDPASLRHFRLFFEAFLGFYKVERPSDN